MSDASRHAAHIVPETVYGTTPDPAPFSRIRHTGVTLGVQRGSIQSDELRDDRQISDFRLGTTTVAGDINTELSFSSFDDLLQAVLCGTWAPKATLNALTLSIDDADDSINDSGDGFVDAGFEAGDVVTLAGFDDNVENVGTFVIDTVAAGKITLLASDGVASADLVTEAAGDDATIETTETILKAGVTRRSFSILRHFSDIAATGDGKPYHLFNGCEFNTLALAVSPSAIVTAAFGVLGREGVAPSNTPPANSTFAAAETTAPLDAFTGELTEGVTALGTVTEFSVNLENGLEARPVVGSKLTLRPSIGRSNLTGSATVYFEDASFVEKFINEDDVALSFTLPDGAGNEYIFEFPRVKFTAGQPDVSGQGSITLSMPFQGIMDTTEETNIIIHRKPAVA